MSQDPRQAIKAYELAGDPFIACVREAATDGRLLFLTCPSSASHLVGCVCTICKIQNLILRFSTDDLEFFKKIGIAIEKEEEKDNATE